MLLLLAVLLAGCGASTPDGRLTPFPTSTARPELAFTLPATWTAEPTRTTGPRQTATVTQTPTITATPLGINNPYLTGVEALLPEGSRPMRERAWRIGGEGPFWGFMILPVETVAEDGDSVAEDGDSGIDVALLGLPSGENGAWDRKTIYLLWMWSTENREPTAWAEIRMLPYAPEQAERAFLARDQAGNWHVVPLFIAEEVTAGPLLPVASPEDVSLAVVEKPDGTLFVLRDGERIAVHGENALLWEDPVSPDGLLRVIEGAPPSRVDGKGPTELMLHWSGTTGAPGAEGGTLQLLQRTGGEMALAAVVSGRAQFLEINGDGFREFLLPDDVNNPTRWEVLRWDGERYAPAPALIMAEVTTPQAQRVTDWQNLPALPAALYLRNTEGRWAVWPEEGGALADFTGTPPEPQPCTFGFGESIPCRSPDRRYEITAVPAELPPTAAPEATAVPTETILPEETATLAPAPTGGNGTPAATASPTATLAPTTAPLPRLVSGIRGGGRTVEIPDTLNYTGVSSFAWGPNGLLMGWAGITGGLFQVNPATGATTPLIETVICNPALAACPQRSTGMGVISPRALPGGAIGFALQSTVPGQYPPPGIYRRDADGTLNLLADLRLLEPYCVATRAGYDFGQVLWSPDGEAFLYYSPPACLDGILLVGRTDGSALYDLSNLPGVITDIRWGD